MNRTIILKRSVRVRCWRVVGRVAKGVKRTELIPVLLRARETGGTDGRDLADDLFFDSRSRKVVADRLLRIGVAYGLLEKRNRVFTLTDAGETAIDADRVFVPEHGAWTIWASEDPLLPSPILRVDAWNEPSAFDEIKGQKREDAKERSHENSPAWLRKVIKRPITPVVGAAAICIDHLEDKAEAVETNGTLRLIWNVGDRRLQLTGTLEGKKVATELEAPPKSLNQIWRTLLEEEALLERWDVDREKLYVSFDDTDDTEREAISRDLEFESPGIPGYGKFETLTVRGVPITPATESDAQSWANWRLQLRIRDYATSERYAAWRVEAAAPFDRYDIKFPTRTQLTWEFWKRTTARHNPRAWRLAAAEDWNL